MPKGFPFPCIPNKDSKLLFHEFREIWGWRSSDLKLLQCPNLLSHSPWKCVLVVSVSNTETVIECMADATVKITFSILYC